MRTIVRMILDATTPNASGVKSRRNQDRNEKMSLDLKFSTNKSAEKQAPRRCTQNLHGRKLVPKTTNDTSGLRRAFRRCSTWLRKGVKSVGSVIPESWSMTIETLLRKVAILLGLSLMATGGRLVRYGVKSESVESFVQTVIENTQSSSKDTTSKKKYSGKLEFSPRGTDLTYENPHDFLHDVSRGVLSPAEVTLEQWLIASGYAMIDQKLPDLEMVLMARGQVFGLHHCIQSINYPNLVKPIMENQH